MGRLELVHVAIDERGGLVHVPAAADEVHQGVGVALPLAKGLPTKWEGKYIKKKGKKSSKISKTTSSQVN